MPTQEKECCRKTREEVKRVLEEIDHGEATHHCLCLDYAKNEAIEKLGV